MKNLKIKSIFFSLMAIVMVTVFLTSCNKDTIQNESPVETENQLSSEESLTTNQIKLSEFQNISYSNSKNQVFGNNGSPINSYVELNGDLFINKTGVVSGSVWASNNEKNIDGLLSFENEYIFYKRGNESVKIDLNDMENMIVSSSGNKKEGAVNGFLVMDDLINRQNNKNGQLSIEAQAISSIMAIFNSNEWIANANFAFESSELSLRGCSWWKKGLIYAAGGAIAAASTMGCSAFAAACGVTIFPSIGSTAIPCWLASGACYAAAWGGTSAAYDYLKDRYC